MVNFKSPTSSKIHHVMNEDVDDGFIIRNEIGKERKTQDDWNNTALVQKGWNYNKYSTKVDHYVDYEVSGREIMARQNRLKRRAYSNRSLFNY